MSTASVSASEVAAEPITTGRVLQGMLRWGLRLFVTATALALWLGVLVLLLALCLPDGTGRGIPTDLSLNYLAVAIIFLYVTGVAPFMLLPMSEEDRFTWILFAAHGWVLCLLGSVFGLWLHGNIRITPMPAELLNYRAFGATMAGIFLIPIVVVAVLPMDGRRKLQALVALLLCWGLFQGGHLALMQTDDYRNLAAEYGANEKIAVLLASLLPVILVTSLTIPDNKQGRADLLGFLSLIWTFLLAGLLSYQLLYRVEGQTPPIVLKGSVGYPIFLCLLIAPFLAPLFGWLGGPWARPQRLAWLLCLASAAGIVLLIAFLVPHAQSDNFLHHAWENYGGPRLIPRVWGF